ncbi:integrase/recombinase XerC [Bacteroidales bacterium WCE2004]|nr:integrase/recombinase XerC [Bacteroidales bacterium WCE2004]
MIERYLDYLSAIRRYSPRTIEIYRGVLEDFCIYSRRGELPPETSGDSAGPLPLPSEAGPSLLRSRGWLRFPEAVADAAKWLNVQTVRAYEVYLLDERKEGAKTVNLHLSVLSGFCKFLMKEGALESNPVRLVSRPKQEKRLPVFYREDAMRTYFEQTKGVLEFGKYEDQLQRMILGMLFATGLRRAELISLNRESVDLARRVLRVRGKGDKMREIPLPPVLCDEILLYLQAVDSLKYADRASEAPLLQTPRGERLYPVYVDRAVKAALAGIDGISGRKSPHVLRHTLATELLDGGADLNSIKELLGHSSLAATQVYTHNSIERLQSVYKSAHPRAKNDGNYGD